MHRRYNRWWSRFEQPDPYDGSYDMAEPQSFNRYSYVQNDPVNFVDPTGLVTYDGAPDPHLIADGLVGGLLWGIQQGGVFGYQTRYSVSERESFDFWTFSFFAQNPSRVPFPGVDAIRTRLNTGGCNDYIARLLTKANELYGGGGNVPIAKDGLDVLKKISAFTLVDDLRINGYPVGGTVSGSAAAGTATVQLSTRFMYGNSASTITMWQNQYVSTAIHEMLHLSGRYVGYDDTQLATAASKFPGAAPNLPAPPKDNDDILGIFRNSDYYRNELMKHCGPPK